MPNGLENSPSFWKKPPSNFTTRQSRLAVTVTAPVGDPHAGEYPLESENPNTYWIVFVDAKYAKHSGFTYADIQNRQHNNHARVLARNTVEDVYIEQGTLLEVTFYDGQWWFTRGFGDMGSVSSGSEPFESEELSGSELFESEEISGSELFESEGSGQESESAIGSEKDTAVVPASWSPGGYTALAALESPDVRFDEVMTVKMSGPEASFPIDQRYLEVCHPGTISICGCVPDVPIAVGASIVDGSVRVRLADGGADDVRLTIRLTGIRKGFINWRFPDRTALEFAANERRIKGIFDSPKK